MLGRHPLFAVLLLGIAIGSGILFAWRGRHANADTGGARLLAVLPFENLGPADEDYFVDGITDEIRGRLTALPALRVTSRSSSSQPTTPISGAGATSSGPGSTSSRRS